MERGRTLYVFAPDTDLDVHVQRPVRRDLATGDRLRRDYGRGDAKASLLGTSKRADGSMQVTYAGHPLYTYVSDTAKGDAKGQGLNVDGGLWWVVAADGSSIMKTASFGPASGRPRMPPASAYLGV